LIRLNLALQFLRADGIGVHAILRCEIADARNLRSVLAAWNLHAAQVVVARQEIIAFLQLHRVHSLMQILGGVGAHAAHFLVQRPFHRLVELRLLVSEFGTVVPSIARGP
jgi:hypothetical protein